MDQTTITGIDSRYAWFRLAAALALITIGTAGMYVVVVALPSIEREFDAARSDASLPYAMIMIGWGLGGIVMGRLVDRFGVIVPVVIGACSLGLGLCAAGMARSLWQFALVNGFLIGFLGVSATFAPLLADISHWFTRRRGIAVAICASGNYLAGAVWPPIVNYSIATVGWRETYIALGVFSVVTMLPLALMLRRRPPIDVENHTNPEAVAVPARPLGMSCGMLQASLGVAGVGCCVAMAMPQVHLVSLSNDLGFGVAHGAEMLSLMLGCGVVSRLGFGWICDRIGGLRTLLISSSLQCFALVLFLPVEQLVTLYVVSALFGLFQGGIVPCYAIIVREHFPPNETGRRVGIVIMATLMGMALGGWLSGAIFDWTGSYAVAFANGIAWNLLNISIVVFLLRQEACSRRKIAHAATTDMNKGKLGGRGTEVTGIGTL